MITPYDWQESIGNRAQYIEGKIKHGAPVLAVSLDEGVLIYTRRRQNRKIFEVYDRLAYSAIGQQSDVEALRSAAVEFAHQEGFNRSEQDVTAQRVVTALSQPVKKAFADFSSAPLVARSLFAEVNESVDEDQYYVLDYDGDYAATSRFAIVAGSHEAADSIREALGSLKSSLKTTAAVKELADLWSQAIKATDDELDYAEMEAEALLIERSNAREDRFRKIEV